MLKHVESFDHLGGVSLFTALGYSLGANMSIASGGGRFGSNALFVAMYGNDYIKGDVTLPVISLGNKLIVGFSVMTLDASICIMFRSGTFVNFTILCSINRVYADGAYRAATLQIRMCTGLGTRLYSGEWQRDTNYPDITNDYQYCNSFFLSGPGIPIPNAGIDYHFIELSVDVTNYKNGSVRVDVDGRTYITKTGINTAAYVGFGDNPYDARARLDNVRFETKPASSQGYQSGPCNLYLDSFYLANEAGGYQNAPIGDVLISTAYPIADGAEKRNWIPYENSSQMPDDFPHHELVDDAPVQSGNETTYLEADLDLTEEMLFFGEGLIPPGSELIAVNHRTMFRNVATPGTPKMNSLIPLFQMQGNPIMRSDSLAKRLVGWSYSFLDVMCPIVPVSAEPWREYFLDEAEFGFMLRNAEAFVGHQEDFALEDMVWDTEYNWDLMPEEIDFADEAIDSIGLLMLYFAGVDEATTWIEGSHGYDPDYSDGAEIDTAQFYVGSSSVMLVARDGQPSGFGYVVPGITPSITQTVFFRFHGIDDYLGIFLGDTDEGEVFFDFAIEARDGSVYYWIGAGNEDGDIGIPHTGECLLAADTWHKVEMIVDGRDITVKVNDSEVVTWTAAADNPLFGLGYAEYLNANDVTGNDVWIGSAVIRE
jgi:hypothetical protein